MWLSLSFLVLAPAPEADSAKALFKEMEKPILKCETLQAPVRITAEGGEGKARVIKLQAKVIVGPGNKLDVAIKGTIGENPVEMTVLSDGKKMRARFNDMDATQTQDTPKHMGKMVRASFSRTGVMLPYFLVYNDGPDGKSEEKEFDLDKDYAVSDFKFAKADPKADDGNRAVEYTLKTTRPDETFQVKLWINPKTHLPVKRVMTFTAGKDTITFTEEYNAIALNKEIPDGAFELPKE